MGEKKVRLTITLWDDSGSGIDILDINVNLEKLKEHIRKFERDKKEWEKWQARALRKKREGD